MEIRYEPVAVKRICPAPTFGRTKGHAIGRNSEKAERFRAKSEYPDGFALGIRRECRLWGTKE